MDSGATNHMSPFRSDFTEYAKYAEECHVILGDSATRLSIIGKGKVKQYIKVAPQSYQQMVLSNILHVKGIHRHFLSVSKLDEKGYTLYFAKGQIKISADKTSFSRTKTANLYTVIMWADKPLGSSLSSITTLPIKTWHERMGHLNWESIKQARSSNSPLIGIKLDASEPPCETYPGCVAGKGKHCSFKSSKNQTTQSTLPIEGIHSDLMGPMEVTSIGRHRYPCVFTCDCLSHTWVLKSKDQTFKTFKSFKAMIEKLTGRDIKYFHSDCGGEFMSDKFTTFLEENSIVWETLAPHTPQQNGVAERMNQTLVSGARSVMQHSGMSKGFWAEAMGTTVYIANRTPCKGLGWRTPYEILFSQPPDISHLCVFGYCAWVFINKAKKFQSVPGGLDKHGHHKELHKSHVNTP